MEGDLVMSGCDGVFILLVVVIIASFMLKFCVCISFMKLLVSVSCC